MSKFETIMEHVEFWAWMVSPFLVLGFVLLWMSLGPVGERERWEERKQSVSATRSF